VAAPQAKYRRRGPGLFTCWPPRLESSWGGARAWSGGRPPSAACNTRRERLHFLLPLDGGTLLERRRNATLLEGRRRQRQRLALYRRKRVARLHFELVATEVREDAIPIALEIQDDLEGMVARRYRATKNGIDF